MKVFEMISWINFESYRLGYISARELAERRFLAPIELIDGAKQEELRKIGTSYNNGEPT